MKLYQDAHRLRPTSTTRRACLAALDGSFACGPATAMHSEVTHLQPGEVKERVILLGSWAVETRL